MLNDGQSISRPERNSYGHLYQVVNMAQAEKRIPIHEETFEDLGHFKGAGETWDDVINDLIRARQMENRRRLLERTEDDEYVPLDES